MDSPEIRRRYLNFFEKRGHAIIPSSSLIPENDPSLLFVNSGMFPLIPYLLGEKHPQGQRLVNLQKSFRSDDIEEVGDNRHTTFFEMMGNWSLGDYFKKEQLFWVYEFLVEELGLDIKRLYATVFRGNKEIGVSRDTSSVGYLKEIFLSYGIIAKDIDFSEEKGMQDGRIFYYPEQKNWWSRSGPPAKMPVGEIGGPDSEIFYDLGVGLKLHELSTFKDSPCHLNCDCGRFIEIGNSVFIEFKRTEGGFEKLKQHNVDFGGGLERIVMVKKGLKSIFETDLFKPLIIKIAELSEKKYEDHSKSFEIIADHLKAATFIIGDERGISPSNKQQGYFVRRLLRRAMRYGQKIGIKTEGWGVKISQEVINIYYEYYPELKKNSSFIFQEIEKEEKKFGQTLLKGLREFEKIEGEIKGEEAFNLYQTYGFPIEIIEELAQERGRRVDRDGFEKEFKKHRELSQTASAGVFKGGLADSGETTTRFHTAAHLLLAALRKVLGSEVIQKGSNITSERIRFDFSYHRKMTTEEMNKVEDLVNFYISSDLEVKKEEMSLEEALKLGVIAVFEERYPSRVWVYSIKTAEGEVVSREICHGPHLEKTALIGKIKIIKEEAVSAGVRRVKVVAF